MGSVSKRSYIRSGPFSLSFDLPRAFSQRECNRKAHVRKWTRKTNFEDLLWKAPLVPKRSWQTEKKESLRNDQQHWLATDAWRYRRSHNVAAQSRSQAASGQLPVAARYAEWATLPQLVGPYSSSHCHYAFQTSGVAAQASILVLL